MEAGWPGQHVMALRDGLLGGWTYEQAKQWMAEQGYEPGSNGALHSFWEHYCSPVISERRRAAATHAEEIARLSRDEAVDWSRAAMDRLQQVCFEFLLEDGEGLDTKAIARLMRLILKDRALSHEGRRITLLEETARKAEETKKALEERRDSGGLSEETLEVIERTLGML